MLAMLNIVIAWTWVVQAWRLADKTNAPIFPSRRYWGTQIGWRSAVRIWFFGKAFYLTSAIPAVTYMEVNNLMEDLPIGLLVFNLVGIIVFTIGHILGSFAWRALSKLDAANETVSLGA